jgi:hypothetical protein
MKHPGNPSWKMIYLARRNPALTFEAFPQAWREHAALGRQCRNVQDKIVGVTQCVRLDPAPGLASTEFDGLNLLRLRDRQVAQDIWSDPETLRVMRPDELRVFDRHVRDATLVAQEQVVVDAPAGDWLLAGFLRAADGVDPAALADALERSCAASGAAASLRTVINRAEPEGPAGCDFDAVLELWPRTAQDLAALCEPGGWMDAFSRQLGPALDGPRSRWMTTRVSHRRPA